MLYFSVLGMLKYDSLVGQLKLQLCMPSNKKRLKDPTQTWWWLLFLELQNKGSIWHLFTHGEYFQPQRALFKHWIQTGFLQKKKTTEDNQLSLSRPKLDSVTPSSIWQPSPSLLNRNNVLPGFSSGGWFIFLSWEIWESDQLTTLGKIWKLEVWCKN